MKMEWLSQAACRDRDPELFFPVGRTGRDLVRLREAKRVCQQCPVSQLCLEYALASNQQFGVWGGTSEDERLALKRHRSRSVAKTRTSEDRIEGLLRRARTGARVVTHDAVG